MRSLFAILILFFAPSAYGQDTAPNPEDLERISSEQKAAEARKAELETERAIAQSEIDRLRKDLVGAAAEAETYEQAARDVATRLASLTSEEEDLGAAIYDDRKALTDLLAALQRIERNPPPALAIKPEDAKDAAQAARLLSALTEGLKERADTLTERLTELQLVRNNIDREQRTLAGNEADLRKRRSAIKKVVAEKQTLEKSISQKTVAEEKRLERLATEAKDLKDLITKFEAIARSAQPRVKPQADGSYAQSGIPTPRLKPRSDMPPEPLTLPPDTKRFADARGRLRAPTRGRITTKYNARQKDGSRAKGLTVTTRGEAQVIAPYTGRIEFVGPFKNYDRVMILNVGDGYFILMTGLGETFGNEGQTVLAGEPVGLMPFNVTGGPKLYIEIRKNGAPINPTPWLGTAFARNG